MHLARTDASAARRMWEQQIVELAPRPRGAHLVTDELVAAVPRVGELRDRGGPRSVVVTLWGE